MAKVLKIFLRANEYGADFPELTELLAKSKKDGFTGFRHTIDVQEALGDFSLSGSRAILRGAKAGVCLANTATFLLDHEIDAVEVDLPNCRTDSDDLSNSSSALQLRENELVGSVGTQQGRSSRLLIVK